MPTAGDRRWMASCGTWPPPGGRARRGRGSWSASVSSGRVVLVGAGPGDPELITLCGLRWLRRAEVVVYDRLVAASLLEEAAGTALLIPAGKSATQHC